MKKIKCGIPGSEVGKPLVDAGVLPDNCGDFVIHVPVHGVVTIYSLCYPGDEEALAKTFQDIADRGLLEMAIEDIRKAERERELKANEQIQPER